MVFRIINDSSFDIMKKMREKQTCDNRGGKNWSSSSRMNNDPESQQIKPQPEEDGGGGGGSRRSGSGRRKRYPREVKKESINLISELID